VLDGLASHVCVLDEGGTLVEVNRAWREFGLANGVADVASHIGASYLAVCEHAARQPDIGAEARTFLEHLRDVLAGRRNRFEFEYACHAPHEHRWFLARVSRISGCVPPRIVVEHDNITLLKQAQETLRRSEALLLDLAASIPGALFRLARRRNGDWHFIYLSPGIESLFGLEARRVRNDPGALWNEILAADRSGFEASLTAAAAGHGPWECECRIATPGGAAKWIQIKANAKESERHEPVWTGVITDVSERRRLEAGLRESEATFRALFEAVPQGIVYHDPGGHISSANPAAQRILGLTLDQMQGRTPIDPRWRAVREDGSEFPGEQHPSMVALHTGKPVNGVVMGVEAPGRGRVWILTDATPLFRHGVLERVHVSFEDITARVQMAQDLQRQASTDYLTGLANRRTLIERLKAEFERVRRWPDRPCSVLALDLDDFKQVNDRWGHATGDAVLVQLAGLMQQESRAVDTVARSGGEEFIVLLPETPSDAALALGERLRERIESAPIEHDGKNLFVTASLGVSTMSPHDPDIDAVLARADFALYQAKSRGRNTVCLMLAPA